MSVRRGAGRSFDVRVFDDPGALGAAAAHDVAEVIRAADGVNWSLVTGFHVDARKAEAVRRTPDGPITTACPASILQTRAHASWYLDRQSACLPAAPP